MLVVMGRRSGVVHRLAGGVLDGVFGEGVRRSGEVGEELVGRDGCDGSGLLGCQLVRVCGSCLLELMGV